MSGDRVRFLPSASGLVLGLDTATPATVAAVQRGDGHGVTRTESPEPGERPAHTRRLLAMAGELLEAVDGRWSDLERVVIGLGPGTFTGIRIGVSTARAVALAAGVPAVGIPTPAALALAVAEDFPDGPVLVVQDARRKELFLTLVAPGELPDGARGLRPWTVPQDELATAVAALRPLPLVAVGDGAVQHREALTALGIAVPEDPRQHAVDGLYLIAAAATTPPAGADDLRPVYVRDADAIPTALRR